MTRRRLLRLVAWSRALAVGLTATIGVVLIAGACSSKSSAVGPGGECFLATDCAPGLVCVEQSNKTRICSDDLSRVAGRPPPEGGAAQADAAGEGGGPDGVTPDGSPPPPPDSGTQDTGSKQDTGLPPIDSGPD